MAETKKNSERLKRNHLFRSISENNLKLISGVIHTYNPLTGSYKILTSTGTEAYGISLLQEFSTILGLQYSYIYSPGTNVLAIRDATNEESMYCILGSYDVVPINDNYGANTIGGVSDKDFIYGFGFNKDKLIQDYQHHKVSGVHNFSDMVVGENASLNTRGVGSAFLTNTSKLIGSGLAKVECFTMDDMVRIISDTFKHVTAFGDFDIYNQNGKLNVVWKGSSTENETFNTDQLNADKNLDPDDFNVPPLSGSDRYYAEYKSRFATYIGKLGNVINCFISDPRPILQKFTDFYYSARGRFHVNEDGSILIQSMGDIVISKSVCIPAPNEKEIPQFTRSEIQENLDAYKLWEPNSNEPYQSMLYKWKNYTKWFTNYYTMAEYWAEDGIYKVPQETECMEVSPNCDDESRPPEDSANLKKNNSQASSITLFRDGSILVVDSYGSAINLSQGDVTVSAAKNLHLNASGVISLRAGRNIEALAVNNVQMSAMEGSMSLKSTNELQQFCKDGPVLITSSATKDSLSTVSQKNANLDNADGCGVVIRTKYSNINIGCSMANAILLEGRSIILKSLTCIISAITTTIKDCVKFTASSLAEFCTSIRASFISARDFLSGTYRPPLTGSGNLVSYSSSYSSPGNADVNDEFQNIAEDLSSYSDAWDYDSLSTYSSSVAKNFSFKYIEDYKDGTDSQNFINITQQNYTDLADNHPFAPYVTKVNFASNPNYGNTTIGYPYPGDASVNFYELNAEANNIATPNTPSIYDINTIKDITFKQRELDYIWSFNPDSSNV